MVNFSGPGKFHRLMSERIIPALWGKGRDFQELGHYPLLPFRVGLGTILALVVVSVS